MRDDMHEIIIERPREGSRMGHTRRMRRFDPKISVARDPDALPFQIGLNRWTMLAKRSKLLNENLAPLRRYLAKQVNRPWNKVWSEISAHLKPTSTVQQHVRDHVADFVATNTCLEDGTVWVGGRFGGREPLAKSRQLLYVDPRTGILRRNKHYKRYSQLRREAAAEAQRERATRMRELGPLLQLHRLRDCWWEVTLASYARPAEPPSSLDVVIGAAMTALPAEKLYGRYGVYAVRKRQLARAEIVRLGLKD
jgi:hypothetical protein